RESAPAPWPCFRRGRAAPRQHPSVSSRCSLRQQKGLRAAVETPDQQGRGGSQAESQAPPHPAGAVTKDKAEYIAAPHANDPVADQSEEERDRGIVEAAQSTHGDDLAAVDDLKESGDDDERRRERQDLGRQRIVRIEKDGGDRFRVRPDE